MFRAMAAARTFRIRRAIITPIKKLWSDGRGVSAIEFALFGGILSLAILNVTDVSIYIYRRMQVENATQMGAQAAWAYCDPSQPGNANILPATTKCSALKPNPGLNAVIDTALHSTSLGTAVSRQSGSPTEGYYCANSSGALVAAGTLSSPSPDCSSVGNGNAVPSDYIQVTAQFTYIPLFPGITVANVLPGAITKTAWMRLN